MNQNKKSQTYILLVVASLCVIGAFALRSKWNFDFFEFLGFKKSKSDQVGLSDTPKYEYNPDSGSSLTGFDVFPERPQIEYSQGFQDYLLDERTIVAQPGFGEQSQSDTIGGFNTNDYAIGFADLREEPSFSAGTAVINPTPAASEVLPVQYATEFPNNRSRPPQDNFSDFSPPAYQPINTENQHGFARNYQDIELDRESNHYTESYRQEQPNNFAQPPREIHENNTGNVATDGFVIPEPPVFNHAGPSQESGSGFIIPEPPAHPSPSPSPPAGAFGQNFTVPEPDNYNNFNGNQPGNFSNTPSTPPNNFPGRNIGATFDPNFGQPVRDGGFFNPQSGIRAENVIVELEPLTGTDMVARVGPRVILECDVISQARRIAVLEIRERLESLSPEERKEISQYMIDKEINNITAAAYQYFLRQQVRNALLYNDFLAFQTKDGIEQIKKNFVSEFDSGEIPHRMKMYKVGTLAELKSLFENEFGTTIERERQLFVDQVIAENWLKIKVQPADAECTYPQMREYYETNIKDFEITGKVRWEQVSAHFSKYSSEEEAYEKVRQMGNMIVAGAPFPEVAKGGSDSINAKNGGLHDWTEQGSLRSKIIENELFTMPVNRLSRIIRDDTGFHIVRVVERQDKSYQDFKQLQKEITEKIKKERTERLEREYFESLQERFPVEILKPEWKPPIKRN